MPSLIDRFRALVGGGVRARPRIVGGVERIADGALQGWVRDGATPEGRADLVIATDTGHSIVARADLLRVDVRIAGHGDGYHGFRVPLTRLGPGVRVVRVRIADGGPELKGSPIVVPSPAPARPPSIGPAVHEIGDARLKLDPMVRGRVSGWLIDTASPGLRPMLELREGTRVIVRDRACRFRADAEGDGMHGFVLHLDPTIEVVYLSLAMAGRPDPLLQLPGPVLPG